MKSFFSLPPIDCYYNSKIDRTFSLQSGVLIDGDPRVSQISGCRPAIGQQGGCAFRGDPLRDAGLDDRDGVIDCRD